jgi:hypothetical protein
VLLPMGDDERMPPDGKPGLTKTQIETLREWIKAGASKTAEKPGGSTTAPTEKPKAAAQPSNQNTPTTRRPRTRRMRPRPHIPQRS